MILEDRLFSELFDPDMPLAEQARCSNELAASFERGTGNKLILHQAIWDDCERAGCDMTLFVLAKPLSLLP